MYSFGARSLKRLNTCHPDLVLIAEAAISASEVDFGISEGYRTIEKQQEYFKNGTSRIDGIKKLGPHNYPESRAFDIYIYHPIQKQLAYDPEHLTYVAGVIMTCAKYLRQNRTVKNNLRWGGNWDSDGILLLDQKLFDRPHFEIYGNIK